MEEKLFTNLSPTIRWIILPFACAIAPILLCLVIGTTFILTVGLNSEDEYPVVFFFKDIVQSFGVGFIFVRAALYVSPSHTGIVMQIIRIIGVCLIALLGLFSYEHNVLDWKNFIFMISMFIGVLIRLDDEKDFIEKFD